MTADDAAVADERFEEQRPQLKAVAYRMLGSFRRPRRQYRIRGCASAAPASTGLTTLADG